MLKNLSIRTGLTVVTGVFVALVVLVGACAFFALGQANQSLRSMYEHDLTATSALARSSEMLLRCRSAKNRYQQLITDGKNDAAGKQMAAARDYCAESQKQWDAFAAVPVSGDGVALVKDATAKHAAMMDNGIMPEFKALEARDFEAYKQIQLQFSSPLYKEFDELSQPLLGFAAKRAQERFASATATAGVVKTVLVASALLALVIGVFLRQALTRIVVKPIMAMAGDFARISAGDLRTPIAAQGDNEIGQLQRALSRMQSDLAGTVRNIRHSAESISVASSEIATGNTDLSARTEQQAASLEETAASMEEISSTVKLNADNATQAAALAADASSKASHGSKVVANVIATMDGISKSSAKIADIISIIEGIAFQTNILALNAAVEAARAGEGGRGFAVVAGEVRSLAQRSSTAAKEIKELIDASVARVSAGSKFVDEAGVTMTEVTQAVHGVTQIMSEISSASGEQSRGIGQVAAAVTQMDGVTQQNAALVEEAAAAAQSLEEQARQLKAALAMFSVSESAGGFAVGPAGRTAADLATQRALALA